MNENKIIKNPTDLAQLLNKVKQDKKYLINKYSLEDRVQIFNDIFSLFELDEIDDDFEYEIAKLSSSFFTIKEAGKLYNNKNYDDLKTVFALCGDFNLKKNAFFENEFGLDVMIFLTYDERKRLIDAIKDEIRPYIKNANDLKKLDLLDSFINENNEFYEHAREKFLEILCSFKSDETKIKILKRVQSCDYDFNHFYEILKSIDFSSENIDLMKQYNLFSNKLFFDKFNDIVCEKVEFAQMDDFIMNTKIVTSNNFYHLLHILLYKNDKDIMKLVKEFIFYNKKDVLEIYDILHFDDDSLDYRNVIIELFNNGYLYKISNLNEKLLSSSLNKKERKIIEMYKLLDEDSKLFYSDFVTRNAKDLSESQIESVYKLINRISISNSSEIEHIKCELIPELLKKPDPFKELTKIEGIYLKNNLPAVGKNYLVFKKLHPTFDDFNIGSDSIASPALKQKGNKRRDAIIFSDMLKASLGSNNRDLKEYLYNLERGNYLFTNILNGNINYNDLNHDDRIILSSLTKHVMTLYNNTQKGKKENVDVNAESSDIENLAKLAELFKGDVNYSEGLKDRIVSMFGHFAGFDTVSDMKNYMNEKVSSANKKNRESAKRNFTLNKGDFVKGIGSVVYLGNILQNGSVARDFLGDSADSDLTPLDTDLSRIKTDFDTIDKTLQNTIAGRYGPVWFVLKDDDRFCITRDFDGKEKEVKKSDLNKIEAFMTRGGDHWGIRTGFASSEIDYIISKNPDKRVGLEVAMNGFYIPVVDLDGNLIFSPKDYDELREKMSGLKHYEENEYKFSDELESEDVLEIASNVEENMIETRIKRNCINKAIQNAINAYNPILKLKTISDADLSTGSVELIDTGSTGRGTNKPGDGDFDFMMKLDNDIFSNADELNKFKEILLNSLGVKDKSGVISSGDFRLKDVNVEGLEKPVDIDITFSKKTNKIKYSTDEALKDRLSTIRSQSPEKYDLVIANIILAKKVLKESEVYKPHRGTLQSQDGLGGVGVENWILQNGGSFKTAAYDFIKSAEGKSFEEFKDSYQIWDFGENHYSAFARDGKIHYLHDNFVTRNMTEEGYKKMVNALKKYIDKNYEREDSIKINM